MTRGTMPAILGGAPLLSAPLPETTTIGHEEIEAVIRVLDSGILSGFYGSASEEFSGGPEVRRFEEAFAKHFDVPHVISVNSATSALEVALTALEIGYGDEVIVPPFTMSATVTAVLRVNAIPVFADIDEATFNIDPAAVSAAVSPQTRAIIAVNLFGQPASLQELRKIADMHGLKLIEDNSQSPGAVLDGRFAGTFGDAGVFSLNQHKTMHCGEGGVVVTSDARVAHRAQLLRNHGEVVIDQLLQHDPHQIYEPLIGNNFRLTELQAAIALEQLRKLEFLTTARVELADRLSEGLSAFDCLRAPFIQQRATHVYFVYPIRFDAEKAGMSRNLFALALAAENLPVGQGYVKPIYRYPIFQGPSHKCLGPFHSARPRYDKDLCPVAERMYARELVVTGICRYPRGGEHVDIFLEAIARTLDSAEQIVDAHEGEPGALGPIGDS